MGDILSKRFWRHVAVQVLPEFLKAPLRRRLQGYVNAQQQFELNVNTADDVIEVDIDQRISFKLPKAMEDELRHYFVGNADYAEEMFGFIKMAEKSELLFDVGAAHGLFSAVFCAISPRHRVIAFEPSPAWLPVFEPMKDLNDFAQRIQLMPLAIGDKEEKLQFYSDPSCGFLQIVPVGYSKETAEVNVTTIDAQCGRLGLQPDLLKVDVEGYELEALRGAEKLLSTRKPGICLELHLNYLEDRGIKPREICDLLQAHRYEFFSCKLEKLNPASIYDSIKPVVRFIAH